MLLKRKHTAEASGMFKNVYLSPIQVSAELLPINFIASPKMTINLLKRMITKL